MKWRSWAIVAAIAIGLIAILATTKFRQISSAIAFAESFPEPSETVFAATVEAIEWSRREHTTGEVVAMQTLELKTEYAGTIAQVGFKSGSLVEEGQLLLTLDSREERAQLKSLNARAELARLTLQRNDSLASKSAVSRQAADTARAELDSLRAEAEGVQVMIDKKTLRAPFDARAGLHQWQPGQYLAAATTVTWLVGTNDNVWVDFSLPQEVALGLLADTVEVRLGKPEWQGQATVIAREPFVAERSRNVRYRALLDNPGTALAPGSIVDVGIAAGRTTPALAVPATALRRDAFGPHVFILNEAEAGADAPLRAERREVDVLEVRGQQAILRSGVEAGEQVAADGAFKLRDQLLVNIAALQ